jgi:hypothetical protein
MQNSAQDSSLNNPQNLTQENLAWPNYCRA